jgi:hypothetical protein
MICLADTPDPLPVWKKKTARCKLTGGRFVLPKPVCEWPPYSFDRLPDFCLEKLRRARKLTWCLMRGGLLLLGGRLAL